MHVVPDVNEVLVRVTVRVRVRVQG